MESCQVGYPGGSTGEVASCFSGKYCISWSALLLPDRLINFGAIFAAQERPEKVHLQFHFTFNYVGMVVYVCGYDCCCRTLNNIQFEIKQSQERGYCSMLVWHLVVDRC